MLTVELTLDTTKQYVYNRYVTADELKTWRDRMGEDMTQAKLAKLLGVNVMTVSRWERGVVPIPAAIDRALKDIEREQK